MKFFGQKIGCPAYNNLPLIIHILGQGIPSLNWPTCFWVWCSHKHWHKSKKTRCITEYNVQILQQSVSHSPVALLINSFLTRPLSGLHVITKSCKIITLRELIPDETELHEASAWIRLLLKWNNHLEYRLLFNSKRGEASLLWSYRNQSKNL